MTDRCGFCGTDLNAKDHERRCDEASFEESRTQDEYDLEK